MPSQFHIHGPFVLENDSALLLIFSSPLVGNHSLQDAAKYITISRLKPLAKGSWSCLSKPLTRLDNWCYLKFWQSTVSRELKDRRLTLLQFWSSIFSSSLNHGLNNYQYHYINSTNIFQHNDKIGCLWYRLGSKYLKSFQHHDANRTNTHNRMTS